MTAYPHLLRSPGASPWRAAAGLLVAGVVTVGLGVAVVTGALLLVAAFGGDATSEESLAPGTVVGLLANNLVLAGLIPASVVAVVAVHRRPAGVLASVVGRPRWGWLLRCLVVAAVVVVAAFGVGLVVPGGGLPSGQARGSDVAVLLAVILLTTPLQAAGEEVGFRGYLTQAVASWFARPVVGAVVAGLVGAGLFALAHGSQDVALFADRFAFGLVAAWLTWRTGGLEAAIALHVVNNLVTLSVTAVTGSLATALAISSLSWPLAALDLAMMGAYALVVTGLARRRAGAVL